MRHIVVDTYCKMLPGSLSCHFVENGLYHRRIEFLARNTVSTSDNACRCFRSTGKSRNHIKTKRLKLGTGLFSAVKHRYCLHRIGNRLAKCLDGEGTVKSHLHHSCLIASLAVEIFHGLAHHIGSRTHCHNHPVGIGCAAVIHKMVWPSGQNRHFIHRLLHYTRKSVIIRIGGLAVLKEHIRVLCRAAQLRMFRIHSRTPECLNFAPVYKRTDFFIINHIDCIHFRRCAPPIEEMKNRHRPLDCCQMCHYGQIHRFLHRRRCKHGKSGRTARHHILVVSENRQSVGCHRAASHVKHYWKQLACYLEHIWNHEHKAL